MGGGERSNLKAEGVTACRLALCEMFGWLPSDVDDRLSLSALDWLNVVWPARPAAPTLTPERRLERLLDREVQRAGLPPLAAVRWVSRGGGARVPGLSDNPALCLAVLAKSSLKAFQARRPPKLRSLPAGRTLLLALPEGWVHPDLAKRAAS